MYSAPGLFVSALVFLLGLAAAGLVAYLIVLGIKALKKYIASKDVREEKAEAAKTLGEALKKARTGRGMTQEFVAEALGVSRQAVSKWESGRSGPSTSNLLALAKLFGVPPEELLRRTAGPQP